MGTATQHLELREGVYYVPGTRISLDSIVYAFQDGASPESIREDFEGLTLPHVYGAISFYLDNRETVESYLQGRKRQWHELEREGVPPSKELLERLTRENRSPTVDEIAELVTKGNDISAFFTNRFRAVRSAADQKKIRP